MHLIIGIDPSYSGTGLAALYNGSVVATKKVKVKTGIYDSVNQLVKIGDEIISQVMEFITSQSEKYCLRPRVIVEYPVFRTISGAYLAVLMGKLEQVLFDSSLVKELIYIPPSACNSFSKNKKSSKTYLVNFVKENYKMKKVSHDEATAVIFCYLLVSIKKGTYKNSFSILK